MRLMPQPPAFDESKKAKIEGSELKESTISWRLFASIWPSRRRKESWWWSSTANASAVVWLEMRTNRSSPCSFERWTARGGRT